MGSSSSKPPVSTAWKVDWEDFVECFGVDTVIQFLEHKGCVGYDDVLRRFCIDGEALIGLVRLLTSKDLLIQDFAVINDLKNTHPQDYEKV